MADKEMPLWIFALAVLLTILVVKGAIYQFPSLGHYF